MKVVGYIKKTLSARDMAAAQEQLLAYGCDEIITDAIENNITRPKFRAMMAKLKSGDTLVVYKFANASRGWIQLSSLMETCRIRNIRLVSTDDHIDTNDSISKDWQSFLGSFGIDVRSGDRAARAVNAACNEIAGTLTKFTSKEVRDSFVIELYEANRPTLEICEKAGIGRSTLHRILRENNIKADRKTHKKDNEVPASGGDTES